MEAMERSMIYGQVDVKHVGGTINQVGVIANVHPVRSSGGVRYGR